MASEFAPSAGLYTAEDLKKLREEAMARAMRKKAAQSQPIAEAPRPVRRPAAAYGTAPASTVPPVVPPARGPASGPIRVPRVSQPVSAPVPEVQRRSYDIIPPHSTIIEKAVERRKPRKAAIVLSLGLVGLALYGANNADLIGADNLGGVAQAGFIGGGSDAESIYGEIELPTVAQAEGLNIENCKKPGAAIATIRVTGNYALRYQLQTPESTVAVPRPYMKEGDLTKGEGAKPENKKFETVSGYPEMTIHDLPLEVYACEKPNTAAVTQSDGVNTVNVANIDFSVKPVLPAEQDNKIQTEAYMSSISPTTFYTWPSQTFLKPNAERYTDASVEAANAAHAGADQQIGVFNTAIQSIIANAADADTNSTFNTSVTFIQKDISNIYDAMKEGLEVRLGSENVEWNGTIGGITPMLNDKRPSLIDTSSAPEDSFKVIEGEVTVGHYVQTSEDKE